MLELDSWLEIAKSAALEGGQYLLENQNKEQKILLNKGRDIKLQLDADTEQLIKHSLASKSEFSILGEETGLSNDVGEFYWVVDPLDGTSNFLRDIPISCVSIALMQNVTPILGVIYDFNHDDLYFGHLDSSAFVNQIEIKVSDYADKSQSTLVTGIPAKTNYSDNEFKHMIDDFQQWKKVRMIGSAAMASIYVAAGKADTYKENGIFLWDIAAGAAIVNAAGGVASITNVQADFRVDALFTNQNLAC
ncbi:inositol monophosphatase [Gammaproteobacteria bacterium]|jgi:myo-inositol-1(or 4)-monophosphatase|nr:inositol monophosphatase [Gammaproteobacteria bacterium]MDA9834641.1 inositol monophosphatase [Gammaproteobacteria bacterium]MDA9979666.1 inositol monophosphatase [Gammaproteobacteria bacterium]MDC3371943.1 inositol monophosphatase [Gammaproteobacteria bacterium]